MIEILRFATLVIATIGTAIALLCLIIELVDKHNEKAAIILICRRVLGDKDSCTITEGDSQVTLKRIYGGVEIDFRGSMVAKIEERE